MYRLFIAALIMLVISCSESKNNSKPTVTVTNYPLSWLVTEIAGNTIDVVYRIPEDIDPAYWQPKDNDIHAMQKTDLILLNGASYEKWVTSVELPASKTVNTTKSFKEMFITIKDAEVHEHNGVKHSHDGIDFNTWLDPKILISQSENVLKHLIKLNPNLADEYTKNN